MVASIEVRIKEYTAQVFSGKLSMPTGACPRCLQGPDLYKLHDHRWRSFRYTVDNFVRIIETVLVRWKCPLCKRRFTDYPDFAIPYKRYVADDVERLSAAYAEDDGENYEGVVLHEQMGIACEPEEGRNIGPQLNKSTPWRWLGCLGTQPDLLGATLAVLRRKNLGQDIGKFPVCIPRRKYRSEKRKQVLNNARLLLRVNQACKRLFGLSLFPRIATPAGRTSYILLTMG